ncbi:MAG: ABC transporter substrate-binding protein [Clostridiales bacterium]|nr:ABC transporter substrate-binding protein [Clostridiales bacterium]
MKKTIKTIALILVLVLAFGVFTGCGDTGTKKPATTTTAPDTTASSDIKAVTEEVKPEDVEEDVDANETRVLNISLTDDCGTLNPMHSSGSFVSVTYAFYEPLWDLTPSGEKIWLLATSYESVSEIEYKLTIREGVKFANGNPLTADDVMFTMKLCKEDPRFYLNVKAIDFEKTKVTGPYTMDVWYTNYDVTQEPNMLQMLIYDEESYDDEYMSNHTIGTGPYIVTDYVVNSHITAERNENYWGEPAKIKTIRFKVISESAQVVNALETGDIDIASTVTVADASYIESLGHTVDKAWGGYSHTAYFSFNGPLATKEARWAVSYAMDREAMNKVMFDGASTVPKNPCSVHMIDYEERFDNLTDYYKTGYNLEKAKEYAEKSGLVGKTLKIITNGWEIYNDAALVLQQSLKQIGVEATITPLDQATYFGALMDETGFDIGFYFASSPCMLAADALANYPDFIPLGWKGESREEYGRISHGAASTFDPAERSELLYETMVMFADYDMWMPVCEALSHRAWASDVANVTYRLAGNCDYASITFK